MPYQGYPDGLYLVKRKVKGKPIFNHYGVIDIGNNMQIPDVTPGYPTVIHQCHTGLRIDDLSGQWGIVGRVRDECLDGALERINYAFGDPEYDLFKNNCEHFARFVTDGKKESRQLQGAAWVGGTLLAVIGFGLLDSNGPDEDEWD